MGQFQVPGTSVQYSNPKQVDQSTLVNPLLPNKVWAPLNPDQGCGTPPQPGSFDATPPKAPKIIFRNPDLG